MNKQLLICQVLASPKSSYDVFKESFETLHNRTGLRDDYFDHLVIIDIDVIPKNIHVFLHEKVKQHKNILIVSSRGSWAKDIHVAFNLTVSNSYKYLAMFHDDVFMRSDNWFSIIDKNITPLSNVGVITSTDIIYRKICTPMTPVRDGYYTDVYNGSWNKGIAYQYHNLPENWGRTKLYPQWTDDLEAQLDYPEGPVKVLSSWSAVMILKAETIKNVPAIEDWSPWTLLNEFDFNLECLKRGYYNCWLPSLQTEHYRDVRNPQTRSTDLIAKYRDTVHKAFKDKWGFSHDPIKEEIPIILESQKDNPIVEFVDKSNSYDWRYF